MRHIDASVEDLSPEAAIHLKLFGKHQKTFPKLIGQLSSHIYFSLVNASKNFGTFSVHAFENYRVSKFRDTQPDGQPGTRKFSFRLTKETVHSLRSMN